MQIVHRKLPNSGYNPRGFCESRLAREGAAIDKQGIPVTAALPPTALRNVLTALMLAIFLGALDQTIVAVSLPAISAQFNDVGPVSYTHLTLPTTPYV